MINPFTGKVVSMERKEALVEKILDFEIADLAETNPVYIE